MPATVECNTGVFSKTGTVTLYADGSSTPISAGSFTPDARPGTYTFSNSTYTGLYRIDLIATGQTLPFATVWATLATTGSIFAYSTREAAVGATLSITIPAAVASASQNPQQITCVRGDTLVYDNSDYLMGNISTRTKMWLTAKASDSDADADAIIQVIEGTGLTILNGSSSVTAGNASLVVSNATTGEYVLTISAVETAKLAVRDLVWDCQFKTSTGVSTPNSGVFSVSADVTKATS